MGNTYSPALERRPELWGRGTVIPASNVPYWERWTGRRCLALHALVVAVLLVIYAVASPQATLVLGGCLVAPVFFFFVWVETKKSFLKITPISMYFVWHGFALGSAAIYAGTQIVAGVPTYVGMHRALPEYLAKGYMIGVLGTLFLHAGLQWMRPKASSLAAPDPTAQQVKAMLPTLFVLFFLGCGILIFGRQLAFLGVILGFFEFGGHAALLCFVLIPAQRLGIPEFMRAGVLIVATAILAFASTQSNSKLYLMLSLIGIFFYVIQKPKLRKHVPAAGLVLIFIYLTVVAPTVSGARNISYKDKVPYTQALLDAFRLHSPLATGNFDVAFYQDQLETLLSRQFEASSIAVIAEEVDLQGYLNGETFYQIRYFYIPRLFWPDKPNVVRGAWFTSYLGNSAHESDATTSVGMEAAGELYWNFGYSGVVIGMFVLGAMFGGIWRMAGANPATQPLHMTLYMLNALTMMNLPEAASRMASCIAIFIFFGIAFSILRPRGGGAMVAFRRVESPGRV